MAAIDLNGRIRGDGPGGEVFEVQTPWLLNDGILRMVFWNPYISG